MKHKVLKTIQKRVFGDQWKSFVNAKSMHFPDVFNNLIIRLNLKEVATILNVF